MKSVLLSIFLIFISFTGCTDDSTTNSVYNSTEDYRSILYTDEFGNVLGGDTTDWCYRTCVGQDTSGFTVCNRFFPAFPNPVNDTVRFRFDVKIGQPLVKLYYLNSVTDTVFLIKDSLSAGYYLGQWSKHTLGVSNSYRRVYIGIEGFSCFGDVKFN